MNSTTGVYKELYIVNKVIVIVNRGPKTNLFFFILVHFNFNEMLNLIAFSFFLVVDISFTKC